MGSSWTRESFKAWGRVYSEGGRNPLESNSPNHISEQSPWLLPGWVAGNKETAGGPADKLLPQSIEGDRGDG